MGQGNAKEISLGDGFGDVALKVNGATVEVHADGSVAAYTQKDVDAYTNGAVRLHPPGNGLVGEGEVTEIVGAPKALVGEGVVTEIIGEAKIGDKMPAGHPNAGWVYAGTSKTTDQPLYVAPEDSGVFRWKAAMEFAAKGGSRVPSQDELDQIYAARDKGALKETFNITGSNPAGWYWSSRGFNLNAWAQRFSDGNQSNDYKGNASSLRLVR